MTAIFPDDVAFLQACAGHPADALPRLIWADRLCETGRPTESEFVRGGMGEVLVRAAAARLASGGDPKATTEMVLWLAGGGVEQIEAAAKTLFQVARAVGAAFGRLWSRSGTWLPIVSAPPAVEEPGVPTTPGQEE